MLDREKCFDRIDRDLVLSLQRYAGCPLAITRARAAMYRGNVRYVKLGQAFSQPWATSNGVFQGCCFS
eukprot:673016-Alexandrium_andersonii.AAC.1